MLESHVNRRFKLELEPNFSVVIQKYLKEELAEKDIDESVEDFIQNLSKNNLLSLIDTELILNKITHDKSRELKARLTQPPLKTGEWVSLTHNIIDGNRILQAYFNQYNPNDMYRTAWGYIAFDREEKERHGCMLIERERQKTTDLIEFCFFRQNLIDRSIYHYAHIFTEISEKDRERITIGGFVGFRAIMAALAGKKIKISHDAVDNLLNAVVAPIYDFFQTQGDRS
ncbi:MAG: hypothetical protein ACLFSQ_07055 [Candidatus Zixiibacteriota bacterium]